MPTTRERVLRNSVVAFTTFFANFGVRWLIQVMVARVLLKRDVGGWNFLQATAQVIILLAGLGFHGSLLQGAMRRPRLATRMWMQATAVRLVMTALLEVVGLGLIVLAVAQGWVELHGRDYVVLAVLYAGCFVVALKVSPVLDAFQRMDVFYRAQVWTSVAAFVLLAVAFYVLHWRSPVTLVAVQQLAGDGVILVMVWYLHRRIAPIRGKVRWRRAWVMAVRSIPKGLEAFFSESLQVVDKIAIALMIGFAASADYWLAVGYTQIGTILLLRFYRVFRPSLLEGAHRRDRAMLERRFASYLRVFAAMSIPVAVGTAFLAWDFIPRIYGEDYWSAVAPAMILSSICLVNLYYRTYLDVLFAHDDDRRMVGVAGFACGLNLVLNLALIPAWGTSGAALASVASYLVAAGLAMRRVARFATIAVTPHLVRPLAATLPMAVVMWLLLPWGFVAQFLVGGAVWVAAMLPLRPFSREEYELILRGRLARLRPLVRDSWCRTA